LRKSKRSPDHWKNKKGNGIQNKYGAEGYGHFFFASVHDRPDGGDGAAAANRCAGSN
jgi:hypothetical protein